MTDANAHRKALYQILEAADSYYTLRRRFPSRIRLGPSLARNFMGHDTEARFPLRPTEPDQVVVIVVDDGLSPTEIAMDD